MKWRRYRFYTRSVDDVRPLVFNPHYPWWHSGDAGDSSFASIVAYLPVDEPLERYWDDAYEVQYTEEEAITFSDRFPRPAYYQEEDAETLDAIDRAWQVSDEERQRVYTLFLQKLEAKHPGHPWTQKG